MDVSLFIRCLCSLPVILIFIYFYPFVGICLILLRACIYKDRNKISAPIFLIGFGTAIFIPKLLSSVFDILKISKDTIPYLSNIIMSETYNNEITEYGKYIIAAGVVLLVVSTIVKGIVKKIDKKVNEGMQDYIKKSVKQNEEISRENDMKIKEKQQKAKNTSRIKCSKCGADTIVSEKIAICKYCRNPIENINYKG